MTQSMAIGDLSRAAAVKVPTIRFYEQIGLLPAPDRTSNNRRVYSHEAVKRLRFIRHARELGFELDSIRQLLDLSQNSDRSCREVDALAKTHLGEIESRIARLEALRVEIRRMITECSRGQVAHCRVVEVLADHDKCLHECH